jgi:glycine betaine/choline ABC-type transport system substrate-binding protein
MRRFPRALAALLALLALTFVVAACGSDDSGSSSSGSSSSSSSSGGSSSSSSSSDSAPGTLIKKDPANASKTITIGSKNFAEQYILGEIYAQALQAAGFNVKKQLDLGAEQVAFKALRSGKIDAYPEYTGTALTSFYKVKVDDVPRDPTESFDLLKKDLAKDKITPYPQTPFQNTYKVTSTKAEAQKFGNPKTLSELAQKAGSKVRLSGFPECRQRTDCLLGLNQKYDWHPKFVSSQGQYSDLDAKQADFTMGFSTDGALSTDKYYTYEDDKSLFPPYYVTLMTRDEAVQKLGDSGAQVIAAIQKPLTEQVMQELNARVAVDKQKPEAVAKEYLQEAGFEKK